MNAVPLISIIIPFYNTEEKLFSNCLNSVLNQSYTNFELLVIDDGSNEESGLFLDRVATTDDRIHVIHKENGGVSTARNLGVKNAAGEYVAFIDADDVVHCDYLKQSYEIIDKTGTDYVIGAIKDVYDEELHNDVLSEENKDFVNNRYKVYSRPEFIDIIPCLIASNRIIRFDNGGHINRGPVARLLNISIAKKVSFPEGLPIGEDVIWNQYVLAECNSVVITENIWYYYLQNEKSAVHRYRKDAVDIVRREGNTLYDALDMSIDDIYRAFCARMFSETRLLVCSDCLTRKENERAFFSKWREFIDLRKKAPWSYINRRFYKVGDRKEKAIYIMYRCGMYFPIAYIMDRV